ncbi:MAG TPA: MFS transporter [Micromonosporaceae bacterium]
MRRWFNDSVGGLPRAFWFLWAGTLINRIGNFTLLYLEMYLVARYHVSASYAGLVIGLSGAGSAIGSIGGGVLADRWGRRPTMLSASLASAAATLALGATTNTIAIPLLATVYGLFNGLARPAFSAMLVDVLGDRSRIRGFNLNYWAINLGFAGAAIIAGLVSQTPRMTLFSLDAATTAISAIWIFLRVRETSPTHTGSLKVPSGGLRQVLTDRTFLIFVALNFGFWTIISTVGLLPITMLDRGLSPSAYGSVIAVNGILIVAGQLFVPKLIRGRSRTLVLTIAAMLVGIGFGAVAFAPTVLLLSLTVVIWTIGEMASSPTNSSLTADLSVPTMRGRYQGIAGLSYSAAAFCAPIVGGSVIDRYGNTALWLCAFGLGTVVAAGQLLSGPARERRAALLKTPSPATKPAMRPVAYATPAEATVETAEAH